MSRMAAPAGAAWRHAMEEWGTISNTWYDSWQRLRMSSARGQVQAYFPASKVQAYICAYFLNDILTKHIGESGCCSGTRGS